MKNKHKLPSINSIISHSSKLPTPPPNMDITEAFRTEDISKTDFFDFVVTPDNHTHNHPSFQTFRNQMRAVNVYLEDETQSDPSTIPKETNNNNTLLIDAQQTLNNNNIITNDANIAYDPTFWNCDKETVRLETAILEDLNKYCWSQDDQGELVGNNNVAKNTDGHIYTLTVLNGGIETPQAGSWYRQPILKDEDGSLSSPSPMEHNIPQPPQLDIDSILSIIPNGYNNGYDGNTDGMIKSETFTYDDSGYSADAKDDITNSLIIDTPLLETHDSFNNNNNDWKMDNNNTTSNAESLLRSALQGKSFISRYAPKKDTELRRVLGTPPTKDSMENEIILGNNLIDDPSSTQNMDDLLLSQLDNSYPEDYEKLKRIANEVAESVQQYCHLEVVDANNIYINEIPSTTIGNVEIINHLPPNTVTSSNTNKSQPPKKYKRTNSKVSNNTTIQTVATSSTTNTSTNGSNSVRKERSLHYCSICSKGFKDKYSVNVHIRTHTGEKPFACSLCGKSFRQKAHLAKHYQTHIAQKNAAAAAAANANGGSGKKGVVTSVATAITTNTTVASPMVLNSITTTTASSTTTIPTTTSLGTINNIIVQPSTSR